MAFWKLVFFFEWCDNGKVFVDVADITHRKLYWARHITFIFVFKIWSDIICFKQYTRDEGA